VLVHLLTETTRHAGHADILRENLDGNTGHPADRYTDEFWETRRAHIEKAARAKAGRLR